MNILSFEVSHLKNEDVTSSESEIRRASKRGAVEDIIHVASDEDGHDLRVSNRFGANLKQEINDSENM
ncbi:Uncharacterised protein [Mycobacteroides abscessus subsp. abscessus]|jgi:hypothetical protein|nr:Uncharacterised protein [Mycobacteroides abscessus subsp. abscessus]